LDLADALSRVHRLNIIHRDIKPANILLASDGTPRLSDFGVAYLNDASQITQGGVIIGSYPYLPPESWRGEALDWRADIWSFGILLYEMLAGRHPFISSYPAGLHAAILHETPPDLLGLRPDTPVALVHIIRRMLEKDRERRLSSIRELGLVVEGLVRNTSEPQ